MRTTLTLDDNIAARVSEIAHETRRPFKVVVNEILRRGLDEQLPPEPPFKVKGWAGHLRPGIDDRSFNELMWEGDELKVRR